MVSPTQIVLYIPNLIGYARVVLTAVAYWQAELDIRGEGTLGALPAPWIVFAILYTTSFFLDAVDGKAARMFGQSSVYGGVLDMVTDRCSTAGLLMILGRLYPDWFLAFLALLILDYSSHWYQMKESETRHHKAVPPMRNIIVRVFYGVYIFFGFCCVGAELFYVFLYLLHPSHKTAEEAPQLHAFLSTLCWYVWLPGCACKQVVNLAQLTSAAWAIAEKDASPQILIDELQTKLDTLKKDA
jgi:CDP-diacylglycerol--inositol 3-phosphatidyltransferase